MSNELTPKQDFMAPMIPALFGNAMPVQMPPLEWKKGLIEGYFHTVKVRQREKVAMMEANIAECNLKKFMAGLTMIKELTTHSSNIATALAENQHKMQMMELERYEKQQTVQQAIHTSKIMEQQVKQEELKTMTIDVELKTADLTFKRMQREMEKEQANDTAT
jgi:hypothetical protein